MNRLMPILLLLVANTVFAENTEVEVIVQEVADNAITVGYTTNLGEKTATLVVSPKAEISLNGTTITLNQLPLTSKATVEYNREFEVVTKIVAICDGWTAGTIKDGRNVPDIVGPRWSLDEKGILSLKDGCSLQYNQPSFGKDFTFQIDYQFPQGGKIGKMGADTSFPATAGALSMRIGPTGTVVFRNTGDLTYPSDRLTIEKPLGKLEVVNDISNLIHRTSDPERPGWNRLEIVRKGNTFTYNLNGEAINGVTVVDPTQLSGFMQIRSSSDFQLRDPIINGEPALFEMTEVHHRVSCEIY